MQNAKFSASPVQGKGVQRSNSGSIQGGVDASFNWGGLLKTGLNVANQLAQGL
ncbi:MAG: hypothetical protein AAFQ98_05795 [Bacteroidota bacterium]